MATKKKSAPLPVPPREAIIAAALKIADDGGWRAATLRELSEAAALPFAEVYGLFETPGHVAAAVLGDAVTAAMDEVLPDASLSPKDRIFDAAMNVFDGLKDRRTALGAMLAAYRLRPIAGAPALGALARFARVTLERAGIGAGGAAGAARIAVLARALSLVLGVFAEDDAGLSRTMAALDTRLREAERWAKRLGWSDPA
ncbi:hypothetical protein sos41_17230 [Alphaproteobacteria bacterium SO-S41]|nr:hypothetical protein sos41_17230 [Alphaproteobacteria bacterium SO-S41]